jgi:hypothetical protein
MCGHLNCSVLANARLEYLDGAPLLMGCSGGFSFTLPPPPRRECHAPLRSDASDWPMTEEPLSGDFEILSELRVDGAVAFSGANGPQ